MELIKFNSTKSMSECCSFDEYIKYHQNLINKERKKVKKLAAEFEALKDKEQFSPKKLFQLQVAGHNIKFLKSIINKLEKTTSLNNLTHLDTLVIRALTKLITNNNGNPIMLDYIDIVNILGLQRNIKGDFFYRLKKSVSKLTTKKFHRVIPVFVNGKLGHFYENHPIFSSIKINIKEYKSCIN